MDHIEVYMHGENDRDPKLISVPENATVSEIISIYQQEFPHAGLLEEIGLFIEDEDEVKQDSGHHEPIKKRVHIHCHRCRKIEVTIIYNGDDKSFPFAPSTTAKRVLKKATEAFGIKDSDAGDYLLKLDDGTILQPADHIGSFTAFPRCQLKLFLTPTKPVQG